MNVGIVSYFAPPQPAVASHRVLRLTRALAKAGHAVHWITLDPRRLDNRDETLAGLIPTDVRIHGLGGPNLVDVPAARNLPEKVLRTLVFKAPDWIAVPDRHVEWSCRLRRSLPRIVERERLDALLVCCGPHGQILALPRVRRAHPDVRIYVDYRDLLSGNPWRARANARLRRRVLERERRALRSANALFVNSEEARRRFVDTVGAIGDLPVEVMRNTADYDLADEITAATDPVGPGPGLHLGFFGSIFVQRRLLPLLRALAELEDDRLAEVTLHCYCDPHASQQFLSEDLAAIGDRVAQRVVRREFLPYADALRTMRAMDALVLINSPDEDDAVFVPGKLYDYLMARRPVVFLGCEGDAWRIVADTSGPSWCFRYAQKDLIARHLAGLIGTRPPDTQRSTDHEPSRSFAPLLSRLE